MLHHDLAFKRYVLVSELNSSNDLEEKSLLFLTRTQK